MAGEIELSVIIPTINEAEFLLETLESVSECNESGLELLVVDGGSCDDTTAIAHHRGSTVIASPLCQRAHQMNLGAANARGNVLLFLHADCRLPPGGIRSIKHALEDRTVVGGAFARRFDHPSMFLHFTCVLADLRGHVFGLHLGDQGIFVRRRVYQRIGGFPEWDSFEDLEFSRRMSQQGTVATLGPAIRTSGRRFGPHPVKRTLRDLMLTARYLRDQA
jgi:rSAM/selenodomain-associated transferase 2